MQLRLGEQSAVLMSHHNSFVMIVNAALGGGDKAKGPPKVGDEGVKDLAAGHANVEDAVSAILRAMTV